MREHAVRVVIVDDHMVFRLGLRCLLGTLGEFHLIGEACTAREGLALIDAERPEIVIMDVALPGMDGVIATREIKRRAPDTRVLVLSVHDQTYDVLDAMNAGATGYALKFEGGDSLVVALRAVARGERYLAPSLAARMASYESRRRKVSEVLAILSDREREVFRLAAECLITREIARELCISRKTVDTHLYRIHRKLGLRNGAELVRLAATLGVMHGGRHRETATGNGAGDIGGDQHDGRGGDGGTAVVRPMILDAAPSEHDWHSTPGSGPIPAGGGA
jgi:RNA polymerase sigma factor (sigma-70 family)